MEGARWAGSLGGVRCPWCADADDKVVDSRSSEDGVAIRRRRECLGCGRRFTTYERVEEVPFVVVKRSGRREPFDRTKVVRGMAAAAKNRPVASDELERMAADIEEALRLRAGDVRSEQIGVAVLASLRLRDDVAYVRFASVYKEFTGLEDFEREMDSLTPKDPEPGTEALGSGPGDARQAAGHATA